MVNLMATPIRGFIFLTLAMALTIDSATAQDIPPPLPLAAGGHDSFFAWTICVVMFLAILFALLTIKSAVSRSGWKLADALSEDVEVSMVQTATGYVPAASDTVGPLIKMTTMRASSSRLIALVGMIAILVLFVGNALYFLFALAQGWTLPDALFGRLQDYLFGGATLFAPYIVGKLSAAFSSSTGK